MHTTGKKHSQRTNFLLTRHIIIWPTSSKQRGSGVIGAGDEASLVYFLGPDAISLHENMGLESYCSINT